jgi:hypothetical protein
MACRIVVALQRLWIVARGGVEPPTFRFSAAPNRSSPLTKSLVINNYWFDVDSREPA